MHDIEEAAFQRAVEVLEKCSTAHGFNAAYPGYDAIWSRDSMITSLGASLLGDKFKDAFNKSLNVLGKYQSRHGQIPNAVDKYSRRSPHVDYQSIDSTLWFIIGHYIFRERYGDKEYFNSKKNQIDRGFHWLSCQDSEEDGTIEQLPTTDWQDAFPHKYGSTINTQSLYFAVSRLFGNYKLSSKIKRATNDDNGVRLWRGDFYLPWRWKNHNKYKEMGTWFDSLGNLLAIIFNLADDRKADKILNYIKKHKIAEPYPIKAIYPPIKRGSKDWKEYFMDSDARNPYSYLNGGIWTFIGGFYVLALIKRGKLGEAKYQMRKLAEANMKLGGNFSEWLHGKSGKASKGGGQAWNAGMYILAYESLKEERVLV